MDYRAIYILLLMMLLLSACKQLRPGIYNYGIEGFSRKLVFKPNGEGEFKFSIHLLGKGEAKIQWRQKRDTIYTNLQDTTVDAYTFAYIENAKFGLLGTKLVNFRDNSLWIRQHKSVGTKKTKYAR